MKEGHSTAERLGKIADDLLRGVIDAGAYEKVLLPMTFLRWLDGVLAPTKDEVLAAHERFQAEGLTGAALDEALNEVAGQPFHNASPWELSRYQDQPHGVEDNLLRYIEGFSPNIRVIFERFDFQSQVKKMQRVNVLFLVVREFCGLDLSRDDFEEVVHFCAERSGKRLGSFVTPRDVVRLMVELLLGDDDKVLAPGAELSMLDPVCGTAGMLLEAQRYVRKRHPEVTLHAYGQDCFPFAAATAAAALVMSGADGDNVKFGNSLTEDGFSGESFDYLIAAPPFNYKWSKERTFVEDEHSSQGAGNRFSAGLPYHNDGSLLFLQHLISKFDKENGSRLAILLSSAQLFADKVDNIRKWLVENDRLETVIALPGNVLYGTSIPFHVWIVTNRKTAQRKNKIQLIDARELRARRRGARHFIDKQAREKIVALYRDFPDDGLSRVLSNDEICQRDVVIERPLRLRYQMTEEIKALFLDACPHLLDDVEVLDQSMGREPLDNWNVVADKIQEISDARGGSWTVAELRLFRNSFTEKDPSAEPVTANGGYEPDKDLRDRMTVPAGEDVDIFFERVIKSRVSDAWLDRSKDSFLYRINFSQYFTEEQPERPSVEDVAARLRKIRKEMERLLGNLAAVTDHDNGGEPSLRVSEIPWLDKIPAHWDVARLGSVADVRYGLSQRPMDGFEEVAGYRKLSAANIKPGYVDLSDVPVIQAPRENAKSFLLKPGDVLLTVYGTACIWPEIEGDYLHSNSIFAIQSVRISPEWLQLCLSSEAAQNYFKTIMSGTTIPRLTIRAVNDLLIPVPPISEQQEIHKEMLKLDTLQSVTERAVRTLAEYRSALTATAFHGRLAAS